MYFGNQKIKKYKITINMISECRERLKTTAKEMINKIEKCGKNPVK